MDLLGFCLVTLVDSQGVLVLGQHNLGVFRFGDDSFVFRSLQEAKLFLSRPEYYMEQFYTLCRQQPELILLLKVEDFFRDRGIGLVHVKEGQRGASTKVMMDKEVEMHHYEPYPDGQWVSQIDHDHNLNEWVLRRKAIQMANIRNMMTKACQTPDSLFKVENQTQVWLKKEATT